MHATLQLRDEPARVPGPVDAARVALPHPAEVEIWQVALDQPAAVLAVLRTLLSPDEEERAEGFYFERDRRRFIVGRAVLREVLGGYLGCAPRRVAFRYGANGKPELSWPPGGGLQFNLAHSEDVALCAVTAGGPVGVDVERVRDLPEWQHIADTCFSPVERARITAARPEERRREFFQAWTRQEAVLKATGVGLGAIPSTRTAADGRGAGTEGTAPLLRVYPLSGDPGYAAAVAVGLGVRWVTGRRWRAAGASPAEPGRRVRLAEAENFLFQEP